MRGLGADSVDVGPARSAARPPCAATARSPDALLAYSRNAGRLFNTFIDALGWSQTEVLPVLRNRSAYLSLHTEDISRFTTRSRVVYEKAGADPQYYWRDLASAGRAEREEVRVGREKHVAVRCGPVEDCFVKGPQEPELIDVPRCMAGGGHVLTSELGIVLGQLLA